MPKKKNCPSCLKIISEGTRSKIIQQLKRKPSRSGKIGACFCLTQPTISYHMKMLERSGVVSSEKKGREIYYYLNKKYPCKKCFIFKMPFYAKK
ncbi:MAG: metalloregulator ArsR/SmtB family transcription factor [bacterium]